MCGCSRRGEVTGAPDSGSSLPRNRLSSGKTPGELGTFSKENPKQVSEGVLPPQTVTFLTMWVL
jgi:hypothetical protein